MALSPFSPTPIASLPSYPSMRMGAPGPASPVVYFAGGGVTPQAPAPPGPTNPITILPQWYGAKGDDVTDNAAAFAATIAAFIAYTTAGYEAEIAFPAGVYRTSANTNWFQSGMTLRAIGRVIVKGTTAGMTIFSFDAGVAANGYKVKMLGDWVWDSSGVGVNAAAIGLYTRNVHGSDFQCRGRNLQTSTCKIEGAVLNNYWIAQTANGEVLNTVPTAPLTIDGSAIITETTRCDFTVNIETATGTGITLIRCVLSTFRGASESCSVKGVIIPALCNRNLFLNFDFESNPGGDVDCSGKGNRFLGCSAGTVTANRSVKFQAASELNVWDGGYFNDAEVIAGGLNNVFWEFTCATQVVDGGTSTTIYGRQPTLSGGINAAQIPVQEAWTNAVYSGTWSNTDATFTRVQYTIDRSKHEVLLRGEAGLGAAASVIFNLPAAFRPAKQYTFACPGTAGGAPAYVTVKTTGDVQHLTGNVASIELSAIRFFI